MQLFVRRKGKVYLTPAAIILMQDLPQYEDLYVRSHFCCFGIGNYGDSAIYADLILFCIWCRGVVCNFASLFFSKGIQAVYMSSLIFGIVSLICILLFGAKHVKVVDDKLRAKAGKVLDDALVGRK